MLSVVGHIAVADVQPCLAAQGRRLHPAADERVHDLQQASSRARSSATPEPGQPDRQQDPRRVVVRAAARSEAEVPRPCLPGAPLIGGSSGIEKLFYLR